MLCMWWLLAAVAAKSASSRRHRGIVRLDSYSLPRVIGGDVPVLVRLGEGEFPSGPAEDAFRGLVDAIRRNGTALLVGTVGVDFHAGQNVDLAAAYGGLADGAEPRREDLPRFAWFPAAGGGAWVPYRGRPELEPLRSWVQELAGIYFPEPGCSPALDALAAEFATALPPPAAAGAQAVFEYSPKEARAIADRARKIKDAGQAKYYARVMDRSLAEGPRWVEEEAERLQKSRKREERPAERERLDEKANVLRKFTDALGARAAAEGACAASDATCAAAPE